MMAGKVAGLGVARSALTVRRSTRRGGVRRRGVVGALAVCAVVFGMPSVASAGPVLGVGVSILPFMTVGDVHQPAQIRFINNSFSGVGQAGFETDSFDLTNISAILTCATPAPASNDCNVGTRDPGVLVPDSVTASGRVGSACAGRTFTVLEVDPLVGRYSFTPDANITLGPSDLSGSPSVCIIDFFVDVRKAPTLDVDPTPGLQTVMKAGAQIFDLNPAPPNQNQNASGTGTSATTIALKTPTINTAASADIVLGAGTLSDTATVTGLVNPVTGVAKIQFIAYGPNDANCSAAPAFDSGNIDLTLTGGPPATGGTASASFTPTAAGTYRWRAFYKGDANNNAVSGPCNPPVDDESSDVAPATPTINTAASADIVLGSGVLSDTATVAGLRNPVTGVAKIRFIAYGPNDANCSAAPAFDSGNINLTLTGGPPATGGTASASFTPTAAGTYRWRAFYIGDANNNAVSGPCNPPVDDESSDVAPATPTINTAASADIVLGSGVLSDTATVAGLRNPVTGVAKIRFIAYGPNDANCSAAPAFDSGNVNLTLTGGPPATGGTASASFTPTAAGTYRWRAFYIGDANNNAVSGPCNPPVDDESADVAPATPTISTAASADMALGSGVLSDVATVAGSRTRSRVSRRSSSSPTGPTTRTAAIPRCLTRATST